MTWYIGEGGAEREEAEVVEQLVVAWANVALDGGSSVAMAVAQTPPETHKCDVEALFVRYRGRSG